MDGARFSNACAFLGCTPAELTWKAGVDVLCFGGTKNGMAVGEAILFFNHELAEDFDYRCKQAGQLASKMRFLSAPWVGLLQDDAWMHYSRHANSCAQLLAELVADVPGVSLMFPVEANGVFLQMSEPALDYLRARNWRFYTFIGPAARASCAPGIPRRSACASSLPTSAPPWPTPDTSLRPWAALRPRRPAKAGLLRAPHPG